jgi:hypothetical protein
LAFAANRDGANTSNKTATWSEREGFIGGQKRQGLLCS